MPKLGTPWEVLLVEDNAGDTTLFMMAMRESGDGQIHVSCVADGLQALDFLYRKGRHGNAPRPNLIFLDLNIPVLDGRRVLEELKKDARLADIPVIILSTSTAKTDIADSYRRGANSYIVKPADVNVLFETMRTCRAYWFGTVALNSSGR